MRRHTDAELHLLERFLIAQHDAGNDFRLGGVEAVFRGLQMCEVFDDQIDKMVVIEMSGSGYDDVARGEAAGGGFDNVLPLVLLYRFFFDSSPPSLRGFFPYVMRKEFRGAVLWS